MELEVGQRLPLSKIMTTGTGEWPKSQETYAEVLKVEPMTFQGEEGKLVTVKIVTPSEEGQTEYKPTEYWFSDSVDYSYRLDRTKMPEKYRSKFLNDFRWNVYPCDMEYTKKIIDNYVLKFRDSFLAQRRGLYIYSSVKGSGKTFLACAIGNEIARRYGANVKFVTADHYLEMCKDKDGTQKQQIREADLLILDDFGVQDDSKEWIIECFYGLINYRYGNIGSTIITSNVPRGYDGTEDRIKSRFEEMCVEIHLPEYSVRSAKAKADEKRFLAELLAEGDPT